MCTWVVGKNKIAGKNGFEKEEVSGSENLHKKKIM
jgi:hypothetical protein